MSSTYQPILTPNQHQTFGIQEMVLNPIANFDDQGLGKTKQCYDTIAKYFEDGNIDLSIIVAKASLRENLFAEIKNDADQLSVQIISGNRQERLNSYRYLSHHVIVISYETLISDIGPLSELCKVNRVLLAFDESHYLKNIKARRTKAALQLSDLCTKTLIFSGTPIPNGVEDIYPQLRLLGFKVGNTVEEFKKRFKDIEDLKIFLDDKFIRRKKESLTALNIPKKNIHIHKVKLTKKESKIYQEIKRGTLESFNSKEELNLNNVLTKMLRLHQFASNPELINEDSTFEGAKIKKLDQLLESFLSKGKKVIVWTSYRHNIFNISSKYSQYNPTTLVGGLSQEERKNNAFAFQNSEECRLLLATPACAREGFTLTSSHIAIYLDRSFSYLDWAQSQDRIHRISQKKQCHIICLEAVNTIDEKIDEILDLKGDLQSYLLGDSFKPPKKSITYEDLKKLLS